MTSPTVLQNGRIVHGDRIAVEDILIQGERIAAVGSDLAVPAGTVVVDCTNKLVFPGAIDAHTHMGIPIKDGFSADDFLSGSRAALHGGVTTIIDFTSLGNGQTLHDSVAERMAQAAKCLTDYTFHVNVTRDDPTLRAEIPELVREGINSFKVFTTYREAGLMLAYEQIEHVAEAVANANGLLLIHAEDDAMVNAAASKLDPASTDPFNHSMSRPAAAEAEAITKLAGISRRTGCRMYIVHLSSEAGLEAAHDHDALTLETCPQYLFLTEDKYKLPDGAMYVASPPLHQESDCRALRGELGNRISVLATDHCPFFRVDKPADLPYGRIPNGMGGVETLFPLTLAHFLHEGLDLSTLARIVAENPAASFDLAHRKGKLEPGYDADLCVFDPSAVTSDWFDRRASVTDWSAFAGMPALFPERVRRRGEEAVVDGTLRDVSVGKFVKAKAREER